MDPDIVRTTLRGFSIERGEWVYGVEVYGVANPATVPKLLTFVDNQLAWVPVLRSTICRSTGIRDSGGRMVFENDKVELSFSDYTSVHIVKWGGDLEDGTYPAFDFVPDLGEGANGFSVCLSQGLSLIHI